MSLHLFTTRSVLHFLFFSRIGTSPLIINAGGTELDVHIRLAKKYLSVSSSDSGIFKALSDEDLRDCTMVDKIENVHSCMWENMKSAKAVTATQGPDEVIN